MNKKIKLISIFLFVAFLMFNAIKVKADWVQINNGLGLRGVNTLCSYTNGGVNYIFAGTQYGSGSGVFVTTNNGDNWTLSWHISNDVWALTHSGNYLYMGCSNGMGYTTNNGANWYDRGLGHPISSVASSNGYVFGGSVWSSFDPDGVYKSTNYGVDWTQTSLPSCQYSGYDVAINGDNVYASHSCGTYVSTDLGSTWTQSNANFGVSSFAFSTNYIFAGVSNGLGVSVYKSSDNGLNWLSTSLDSVDTHVILVYGNYIFAGGYANGGGFFVSSDNGVTWAQRPEGMGSCVTLCISNGYLIAGTSGTGAYRRPLSELVGIEKISEIIPTTLDLKQNYPNPFNSQTTFEMNIPKRDNYTLNIFDVLGRKVDVAFNGFLNSGSYQINYSADKLASGIYFYSLKSNYYSKTRKFILTK